RDKKPEEKRKYVVDARIGPDKTFANVLCGIDELNVGQVCRLYHHGFLALGQEEVDDVLCKVITSLDPKVFLPVRWQFAEFALKLRNPPCSHLKVIFDGTAGGADILKQHALE